MIYQLGNYGLINTVCSLDVNLEDNLVIIKAVGWKEHNQLFIRGKESKL